MDNAYWNNILSPKEEIKKQFGVGKKFIKYNFIFWLIIGIAGLPILIGFIILPITLFYYLVYIKKAYQYALTNKRILVKKGLFSTKFTSVDYDKITDIHVNEPFWQKFYKTGDLIVNTAGSDTAEIVLNYIENPYKVKKEIDEIRG